jgi:hypothetical protein
MAGWRQEQRRRLSRRPPEPGSRAVKERGVGADAFVGGMLSTLSAWIIGFASFVVRVRAGAEVSASPRLVFRLNHYSLMSIKAKPKKRGRPATGRDPMMGFRASPLLRAWIVKWAEGQPDKPTLSEATRRLVEIGLKAKGK